jgi:RHS repeat-associated protein
MSRILLTTRRSLVATLFLSLLPCFVASLFPASTSAQVTTGTPPFGSFGGGPDVINLANLNSHIAIPVLHKPGRGLNFTYDLSYDTSVWYPVTSGSTTTWQPAGNWGWRGITEAETGIVSNTATITGTCQSCVVCGPNGQQCCHSLTGQVTLSNWVYSDPWGVPHSFSGSAIVNTGNCSPPSSSGFTSTATDGSGYTLTVVGSSNGGILTQISIAKSDGTNLYGPVNSGSGAGSGTDRNGNQITVDSSGHFYDTLSSTTPVLTVAGSGTPSSPMTFTYTAPSGANAPYTMNYTNYTVATNFGVSGTHEYKSAAAVALVSTIVLPDGSQYAFQYEATPGTCTPYSGTTCVTARVKSVTLPTGGTITYAYSGGNNGILPDGSTATLTRTTPDGTWTYAQVKGTGAASTTTITDPTTPTANQTVVQFQGIYETQRQVYQGSTSGTLLETINTCYNASTSPCTGTAIALPITQRSVTPQFPSGLQAVYIYNYNSFGLLTNEYDHDFGPAGSNPLIRETDVAFAALGNNINAFKQTVTVKDGSGTIKAQTTYNYDETSPTSTSGIAQHTSVTGSRGNLTSIDYPVSGLVEHLTYYDTGSISTDQDVNGATTTYNYSSNTASCQMAFPTGVSEPLSLSQSYAWNCTGGVLTSITDENSKTTSTSYSDAYFWRPASVTDPLNNATGFYYQPNPTYCCPWAVAATLSFNNGNSVTEDLQYKDGLGRTYVDQHPQSPGSSTLDSVSYTFDANGRPYSTSMPCSISPAQTCSTPKTTQTYDALNRPLQTTDGGGGTVSYSYSGNDVLLTMGPAPTGENTKQRQLEYDSLGRLTSVCEITSILPGNGSCAQTNAKTGYWTKYSYDALGNLLIVTQNAQASSGSQQTRTYAFDAMGRLTSETNPENGVTTYTYDTISSGACAGTFYRDLLKRVDAIGNVTCYTYDLLHRTLGQTYAVSSPTVATPNKYFVYDTATVNSTSMQNAKTRLAEAYTCVSPCSTKITDLGFSYSARGETTDVYESTTHSGGYYHLTAAYWANGALNQLGNNIASLPAVTYSVDGEGRPSTVSDGSGHGPVTSTVSNLYTTPPQLKVTLGSGDSDVFSFDASTFRLNKYQFNIGSQSVVGTLGWNANWSLGSLNITDPFTSANTQNCSYTADDLSRISQVNCGTIWGQNFTYDPFGNIQKNKISGSGATSFTPTYQSSPSITNRILQIGTQNPSYDANGNSLNDTFRTFTWDAENRPVTIGSVTLTYDALGRMVEQTVSGANSEVVYSPLGGKLALMNGTTLAKAFVPLTGGATAVYTGSGQASYYRHTDHLGSSRFASTPTQTLYSDTAYSPFGEPYASSGSIDTSFTGQNQDTLAGLYDFLYREYDPNQSRWTSPDPAGLASVNPAFPQSWNRYVYALNNPLRLLDPTGLACVDSGGNIIVDEDGNEIYGDQSACESGGGTWIDPVDTTVLVNGDDPSDPGGNGSGLPAGGCSFWYQDGMLQGTLCGTQFSPTSQPVTSLQLLGAAAKGTRLAGGVIPTVCGPVGVFGYAGGSKLSGIVEYDSKSGLSAGALGEYKGVGGVVTSTNNGLQGSPIVFAGEGLGAFTTISSTPQAGPFVGGTIPGTNLAVGAGAYGTITSVNGCHE